MRIGTRLEIRFLLKYPSGLTSLTTSTTWRLELKERSLSLIKFTSKSCSMMKLWAQLPLLLMENPTTRWQCKSSDNSMKLINSMKMFLETLSLRMESNVTINRQMSSLRCIKLLLHLRLSLSNLILKTLRPALTYRDTQLGWLDSNLILLLSTSELKRTLSLKDLRSTQSVKQLSLDRATVMDAPRLWPLISILSKNCWEWSSNIEVVTHLMAKVRMILPNR